MEQGAEVQAQHVRTWRSQLPEWSTQAEEESEAEHGQRGAAAEDNMGEAAGRRGHGPGCWVKEAEGRAKLSSPLREKGGDIRSHHKQPEYRSQQGQCKTTGA